MRKTLTSAGAVLLAAAVALFTGEILGLIPAGALNFAGQSALRTIASVAVGGCLLIAIGRWDH